MQQVIETLNAYPWAWPLFIIVARIMDVSIGTVRTITVVRGHRVTAAVLGFFEVLVWVIGTSGVLVEISFVKLISYAVGFAMGNAVGIAIEKRVGLGSQAVILISRKRGHSVAFALRMANFMVTEIPARGGRGKVAFCFVVVSRRKIERVMQIARGVDRDVKILTHDVRETTLSVGTTVLGHEPTGWRAILKKK